MARHRTDPRGGARIVIAVGAVVTALVLLGVGSYALFGALNPKAPSDGGVRAGSVNASPSHSKSPVLAITVTGKACNVFVATPGNDQVLVNRLLQHGESFFSDEPRLQVAVSDAGAVQIRVNGVPRAPGRPGQQLSFSVTGAGAGSS
jgi:hypothetical protein